MVTCSAQAPVQKKANVTSAKTMLNENRFILFITFPSYLVLENRGSQIRPLPAAILPYPANPHFAPKQPGKPGVRRINAVYCVEKTSTFCIGLLRITMLNKYR
ncbi:MAG: hypothetical protein K9K62_05250 [Desulfobacteraceae bacterium]|nr:hypothetical protein [Desulfobacteraceae bacterium]